jgi:phenylacetate-CoA ligase
MATWEAGTMTRWQRLSRTKKDAIRKRQGRMLRTFVRRQLYPFSPFYRQWFDQAGVDPRSIRTVDDLKRVPFTSKADLAPDDDPKAHRNFILQPDAEKLKTGWGYGRLALRWMREALRGRGLHAGLDQEYRPMFMTATTGRSTRRVPFLYTDHDLENLHEAGGRLVDVTGLTKQDRVVNLFPFAPHLAFWQVTAAGQRSGVFTLGTGGGKVFGTPKNIQTVESLGATAIAGVPGYIYHMMRVAAEEGADFSAVRLVVLGAEKVTPEQKARLLELLAATGAHDVSIVGTYGLTEARMAWAECPAGADSTGYHLYPDMGIFEVIDPDSGEVLDEGETGELVYTPLDGRGSVVFRYRTGDIAEGGITWEPCPHCGRLLPRLSSRITRRVRVQDLQLSKVKGTLVNLDDFAHVLGSCKHVEEWQVELRKRNDDPHDLDEIVVYATPRAAASEVEARQEIEQSLRAALEVSPNAVEIEPLPRLLERLGMETELKEKRVVDRRSDAAASGEGSVSARHIRPVRAAEKGPVKMGLGKRGMVVERPKPLTRAGNVIKPVPTGTSRNLKRDDDDANPKARAQEKSGAGKDKA